MAALEAFGTWKLVELPPGRKAIGCRWVFKRKENADGSQERYRSRLVAQGFAQKPHLEYTETYAPVAKFASLRTVLAIAAIENMEVHSMDVSSAFLNGKMDTLVHMRQPSKRLGNGITSSMRRSRTWASGDAPQITLSGSGHGMGRRS